MHRLPIALLLAMLAVAPGAAQESEPADEDGDPAATAEADDAAPEVELTDEEIEDLLEGSDYDDLEEEEFIPSENVRFEQSIPFPTDI